MSEADRTEQLHLLLAEEIDRRVGNVTDALADGAADLYWTEHPTKVKRLVASARDLGLQDELVEFVREQLQGTVHNVLAIFDGDVTLIAS